MSTLSIAKKIRLCFAKSHVPVLRYAQNTPTTRIIFKIPAKKRTILSTVLYTNNIKFKNKINGNTNIFATSLIKNFITAIPLPPHLLRIAIQSLELLVLMQNILNLVLCISKCSCFLLASGHAITEYLHALLERIYI